VISVKVKLYQIMVIPCGMVRVDQLATFFIAVITKELIGFKCTFHVEMLESNYCAPRLHWWPCNLAHIEHRWTSVAQHPICMKLKSYSDQWGKLRTVDFDFEISFQWRYPLACNAVSKISNNFPRSFLLWWTFVSQAENFCLRFFS